ncbi:hypothetical protein Tco_1178089, partial [Tanacetum coccineum]
MDVVAMSVVYVLITPIPEDELWNSLEAKYMAEDASSKKFFVSNFTNYKMTDSKPVMEQYNELLGILGRFTQHKMYLDEAIQEELTLVELGSHLRIEESLKVHDSDKPKSNNVAGPQLNIVNNIGKLAFISTFKLNDSITWTDRGGEYIDTLYFQSVGVIHEMTSPVLHNKMGSCKTPWSKAENVLVKEALNASLLDMLSILRLLVPRPSLSIPKGTEDIGGLVVTVEDDPKTFDKAMKSQDVAFWKEAINDEM